MSDIHTLVEYINASSAYNVRILTKKVPLFVRWPPQWTSKGHLGSHLARFGYRLELEGRLDLEGGECHVRAGSGSAGRLDC